jgi:pantothenate synthetase
VSVVDRTVWMQVETCWRSGSRRIAAVRDAFMRRLAVRGGLRAQYATFIDRDTGAEIADGTATLGVVVIAAVTFDGYPLRLIDNIVLD